MDFAIKGTDGIQIQAIGIIIIFFFFNFQDIVGFFASKALMKSLDKILDCFWVDFAIRGTDGVKIHAMRD